MIGNLKSFMKSFYPIGKTKNRGLMDFYKKIPPFWQKSLVVIGLLAVLIAVFVVFNGGLEDGVFTKRAVVESGNARVIYEDSGEYDVGPPPEAGLGIKGP